MRAPRRAAHGPQPFLIWQVMTTIHDDDDEYGEHGRYPNPEPGEGWNAMIADAQINNDVVLTLEDLDEDIVAILRNHISGKLKQHGNTALRLTRWRTFCAECKEETDELLREMA